jgi:tetratricopeptide (TPR) repeat protein
VPANKSFKDACMSDNLRKQIRDNLNLRDTEDLVEIWQKGDTAEWSAAAFEIVEAILLERLGYVPTRLIETQVLQNLDNVARYLEQNDVNRALSECELAIQTDPNFAESYNYRGVVYDEMGQPGKALSDFQRALQLDPEFQEAWDNMIGVESKVEEEFEESAVKQQLDQALEYANNDEPEKALAECEAAKPNLPGISRAYNYLGIVLTTLNQLESAIEAYLKAIQLNPRFWAARENLAYARKQLEAEQYHRAAQQSPDESLELSRASIEFDELPDSEIVELPGWMYLDEKAFLLNGWAGHRNRPGRSGLDPLDSDFESSRIQGIVIRQVITLEFRTRNPVYLFLMLFMGLIFSCPILFFLATAAIIQRNNLDVIPLIILYTPCVVIGFAFLINVVLSLIEEPAEDEENGSTFL